MATNAVQLDGNPENPAAGQTSKPADGSAPRPERGVFSFIAGESNGPADGDGGEDADAALARMLQEQERAFFEMSEPEGAYGDDGGNGPHANAPDNGAEGDDAAFARSLHAAELRRHTAALVELMGAPGAEDDPEDDDGVDPDAMSYEELLRLGETVGSARPGATAAVIAALPRVPYGAPGTTACAGDQCTICRNEWVADDELSRLPCGHYLHGECAASWLRRTPDCPLCKRDVRTPAGQLK